MLEDVIDDIGLSPRVRGNQGRVFSAVGWDGSIPACAGEPYPAAVTSETSQVYPRVCGGTEMRRLSPANGTGLSPRVRGNP